MKKIIFLVLTLLLITSCKNREDEEMLNNANFVGTWNWVATSGGLSNVNQTPQNTGKTSSITFTDDHRYTVKENDKILSEGTYTLSIYNTNTDHIQRVLIDFSNYPDKAVKGVTSTSLHLYDDTADGFDYYYTK